MLVHSIKQLRTSPTGKRPSPRECSERQFFLIQPMTFSRLCLTTRPVLCILRSKCFLVQLIGFFFQTAAVGFDRYGLRCAVLYLLICLVCCVLSLYKCLPVAGINIATLFGPLLDVVESGGAFCQFLLGGHQLLGVVLLSFD